MVALLVAPCLRESALGDKLAVLCSAVDLVPQPSDCPW